MKVLLCCAILKLNPGDRNAVKSKTVILIELGRFEGVQQHTNSCSRAQDLFFEEVTSSYSMASSCGPGIG